MQKVDGRGQHLNGATGLARQPGAARLEIAAGELRIHQDKIEMSEVAVPGGGIGLPHREWKLADVHVAPCQARQWRQRGIADHEGKIKGWP